MQLLGGGPPTPRGRRGQDGTACGVLAAQHGVGSPAALPPAASRQCAHWDWLALGCRLNIMGLATDSKTLLERQ